MNFYVKIKIFEKSTKNHFLNKNNLLLLVIIFAIIIEIKIQSNIVGKSKLSKPLGIWTKPQLYQVSNDRWPLPAKGVARRAHLGASDPMGRLAPAGGHWLCPLVSRRLAVASPPPLGFSLYKYLRRPGELITPLTLSHFHPLTHSLALKFLSSIF